MKKKKTYYKTTSIYFLKTLWKASMRMTRDFLVISSRKA